MHARRRGETNANTINHKLDRDPVNKLSLIIDVHSHVSLLGLFIVGNSYDDVYRCVISIQCGKPSHNNFKGGTEILYIETP